MDYKRCSLVDRQLVYKAFLIGFSDYAVPMTLGIDQFFERFFSLEGNALQDSFIALNQDEPVGVIFGGIRRFDGYRNLRCGTLCVSPTLRGSGVGGELFRLFLQNGRERNCERLSLEVLTDNVRALRFYEKRFRSEPFLPSRSRSLRRKSLQGRDPLMPYSLAKRSGVFLRRQNRPMFRRLRSRAPRWGRCRLRFRKDLFLAGLGGLSA